VFMDVGASCFSEYGEGCGLGLQIRVHIIAFPVLRMRKREKRKEKGGSRAGIRHMDTTQSWGA
jgi:hypothetical protein